MQFRDQRLKTKNVVTRAELVMQEELDASSSLAAISRQGTSYPKLSP